MGKDYRGSARRVVAHRIWCAADCIGRRLDLFFDELQSQTRTCEWLTGLPLECPGAVMTLFREHGSHFVHCKMAAHRVRSRCSTRCLLGVPAAVAQRHTATLLREYRDRGFATGPFEWFATGPRKGSRNWRQIGGGPPTCFSEELGFGQHGAEYISAVFASCFFRHES